MFTSLLALSSYASHYALYIETSTSQLTAHAFAYQTSSTIPDIQPIFSTTVTITNTQQTLLLNLKKATTELLNNCINQFNSLHISTQNVAVHFLGTYSMRKLPLLEQQLIYIDLKNMISGNYPFALKKFETISETMEGLYEWLDVNYWEGTFANNTTPYGVIHLNDNYVNITLATTDDHQTKNEVALLINQKNYVVFSKMFIGLGLSPIRQIINTNCNAQTCYPSKQYHYAKCSTCFKDALATMPILEQIIPITQTKFAALDKTYEIYSFFGIEDGSQAALQARINNICSMSWEDMKIEYADSGLTETDLLTMCASGIYIDNLIYQHLQLSSQNLWVTNQSHTGRKFNWSLGALFYDLITISVSPI